MKYSERNGPLAVDPALDALYKELDDASTAMKAIKGLGTGRFGLTPDSVKQSPEYQQATARYRRAFAAVRRANAARARR